MDEIRLDWIGLGWIGLIVLIGLIGWIGRIGLDGIGFDWMIDRSTDRSIVRLFWCLLGLFSFFGDVWFVEFGVSHFPSRWSGFQEFCLLGVGMPRNAACVNLRDPIFIKAAPKSPTPF